MHHSTKYIPLNTTHLSFFLRWFNDPELRPYLYPTTPTDSSAIHTWLSDCVARHDYYLVLCDKTPIGHAGLKLNSHNPFTAEVVIILAVSAHHHAGHGDACLQHIFTIAQKRHLVYLSAEIMPSNLPSLTFFTRHGFAPVYSTNTLASNYHLTKRVNYTQPKGHSFH